MNRTVVILSGLLLAQVLLAIVLWTVNQPNPDSAQALFSFAKNRIDRIEIADAEKNVRLTRVADVWQIPDLAGGLPASPGKVDALIERLLAFRADWPETSTVASHRRFEVAEDKFQRHIRLLSGDQVQAELYIGTSPGFRKSHVRKAGEEAVYSLEISVFDLPTQNIDWLDKSLLAVENITGIDGLDYALVKQDGVWHWAAKNTARSSEAEPLNQDKAIELANALKGLSVIALAEKAEPDPADAIPLTVTTADRSYRYQFWHHDGQHYVQRDDRSPWFTLSAFDFKRLAEIREADLRPAKTESAEPETESAGSETTPAPKE